MLYFFKENTHFCFLLGVNRMVMYRRQNTATALRRQAQIEDCLYQNLLHTPYVSISVTDLCRQVGISRKAFYNYYRDKDACLCSFIDRLLEESMLYLTSLPDQNTALDNTIALLEFWKENGDFLDIVVRNNLISFLILRNMERVLREDRSTLDLLSTEDVESDRDILACYTASQLTLVLQWYSRGFQDPTEEIAKKLLRIIHVPMITPPAK